MAASMAAFQLCRSAELYVPKKHGTPRFDVNYAKGKL